MSHSVSFYNKNNSNPSGGKTLSVKPVIAYKFPERKEKESYRGFVAITNQRTQVRGVLNKNI